MERNAIAHLFTLLASFLLIYAVSAWSLSQGGAAIDQVPGLDGRAPAVSAYFAVLVTSVVLTALSALGISYARSTKSEDLPIPPVGLGSYKLRPKAASVRIYLSLIVVAFILTPAFSLIHLNGKIADGWIWNEQSPAAAAVPVACAMPGFWPFGACEGSYAAAAPILLALTESRGVEPGRLWLANHNCDLVWERGSSGSQVATRMKNGGDVLSAGEKTARTKLDVLSEHDRQAILALELMQNSPADKPPAPEHCEGPRGFSQICYEKIADCRGVTWSNVGSPAAVIALSLIAWISILLYLAILVQRIFIVDEFSGSQPERPTVDKVA